MIDQVLLEAAPESLPTPEIAFLVAERIEIRFSTVGEYRKWAYNCINRELYRKWEAGKIDRLQTIGQATRWKLLTPAAQVTCLADLQAAT